MFNQCDCPFRCYDYSGSVNRLGVNINGIPIEDEIEDLQSASIKYNQLDITEHIIVPDWKPDVEQINWMNLQVCLEKAWVTPSEDKIFIKGILWQKIGYTACNKVQSAHTVENKMPFSHFIDINRINGDCAFESIIQNIENFIVLAPEDAFIQMENGRKLFKNVIVTAFLLNPLGISCDL